MNIRFFCNDDNCELRLVMGRYSLMYGCPRYYKSNRLKNEKICQTDISVYEKQLIVEKLNKAYEEKELFEGSTIEVFPRTYTILLINELDEEIFVGVKKEGTKYEYCKSRKNIPQKNVV